MCIKLQTRAHQTPVWAWDDFYTDTAYLLSTLLFPVKHKYFCLFRRDRLNMQLYGGQTRVHTYTHTQRPMGVRVCSVWWDLEVCAAVSLITAYMIVISDSDYCHGIAPQVTDLFNVIPEGHTLTQTLTNKNTHTYAGTVWKAVPVRVEVRTVSEVWPCRLKCFSVFSSITSTVITIPHIIRAVNTKQVFCPANTLK